jgi:hypothetical protein
MPKLTLLDPRKLKPAQIAKAQRFFDNKGRAFLPAHQIRTDIMRAELDEFVLQELLCVSDLPGSINKMAFLRSKLGEEPSFNGGKA